MFEGHCKGQIAYSSIQRAPQNIMKCPHKIEIGEGRKHHAIEELDRLSAYLSHGNCQ